MANRHRVQLDFSGNAFTRLGEIKELAQAESNSELIRNALRVYEYLLMARRDGKSLRVVTQDGRAHRVEFLF